MKNLIIHPRIKKDLETLDQAVKKELVEIIELLREGESLGMPISRPMSVVAHGVHELRMQDRIGQVRIFYYTKQDENLLVFHLFIKKTQNTPKHEINLARKRLKDLI